MSRHIVWAPFDRWQQQHLEQTVKHLRCCHTPACVGIVTAVSLYNNNIIFAWEAGQLIVVLSFCLSRCDSDGCSKDEILLCQALDVVRHTHTHRYGGSGDVAINERHLKGHPTLHTEPRLR